MAKPQIALSDDPTIKVQLAALAYYPGKLPRPWPHGHWLHSGDPNECSECYLRGNAGEDEEFTQLPKWDWELPKLLENPFLSGPQKFEIMIAVYAAAERTDLWPDTLGEDIPKGITS